MAGSNPGLPHLTSTMKHPTPQQTEADQANIQRFKYLTEVALPARAVAKGWSIRLDHCFKRICLDHAFADVWYNHLQRPAERHIVGGPLQRALACAEALLLGDSTLLQARNVASLTYRGKMEKRHSSSGPQRR